MDPQSSIIQHLTSGYMANIIKCPRIMIKSGSLWPLHINYFSLSTDNVVSCTTTQLKQEWINLTKAVKLLKVHYLFCIAKVLAFKKFRMGGQTKFEPWKQHVFSPSAIFPHFEQKYLLGFLLFISCHALFLR